MNRIIVLASFVLLALPAISFAQGLVGECSDCHTMHNSQQGVEVARVGINGTLSETPNQNLLKWDCIACHAQGGSQNIVSLSGGSNIPQVWHNDSRDLAGGNFQHIANAGNDQAAGRKGHNVVDLGLTVQVDNISDEALDDQAHLVYGYTVYAIPPGQYWISSSGHGKYLSSSLAAGFDKFTCAGAGGCHGTRLQVSESENYTCTSADIVTDGTSSVPECEGLNAGDVVTLITDDSPLRGIAAISGAHHRNYDGAKDPTAPTAGAHSGQYLADSYRFLLGVIGYGNMTNAVDGAPGDRWQNVSSSSHNEYYGSQADANPGDPEWECNSCHIGPRNARLSATSKIKPPNQSMSGFCTTCHGNFHSSGLEVSETHHRGPHNGVSGAFLRHPSDYVIPIKGEYAAYTTYNISAPVARSIVASQVSALVSPGVDMVMCLSCHKAHASEHDGMLRFDYSLQVAGNDTAPNEGCVACHTTKGVSKQP